MDIYDKFFITSFFTFKYWYSGKWPKRKCPGGDVLHQKIIGSTISVDERRSEQSLMDAGLARETAARCHEGDVWSRSSSLWQSHDCCRIAPTSHVVRPCTNAAIWDCSHYHTAPAQCCQRSRASNEPYNECGHHVILTQRGQYRTVSNSG